MADFSNLFDVITMIVHNHPLRQGTPPLWASEWGQDALGPWTAFEVEGVAQVMRWIPPGKFLMGSPDSEPARSRNEGPQHRVTLSHGYWIFDSPCTRELWQTVTGNHKSNFSGLKHPFEIVDSWDDYGQFIEAANRLLPSLKLRLPSEAEWEYACRAGSSAATYGQLDAIAWCDKNSQGKPHDVKLKQPNAWGLYDMLGNVCELCLDSAYRPYKSFPLTDPLYIDTSTPLRISRGGGGMNRPSQLARAASRCADHPSDRFVSLGFRCLSSADPRKKI